MVVAESPARRNPYRPATRNHAPSLANLRESWARITIPTISALSQGRKRVESSILDVALQLGLPGSPGLHTLNKATGSPTRSANRVETFSHPMHSQGAMVRLVLQSLLALTLILNGISAPWAMGRMAHSGHGSAAHHSHGSAGRDPSVATAATDHHGHHDHSGGAPQLPAAPDDGSCCDGTSCQCGCVLPPALSVAVAGIPAPMPGPASHAALPVLLVPHHDSPPLRPPAA